MENIRVHQIKRRLKKTLFDSDLLLLGFIFVFADLVWAITLLWPGDVFVSDTYSLMSRLMTPLGWSMAFMVGASSRVLFWYFRKLHPYFFLVAGYDALLWISSTLSVIIAVYPPPPSVASANIILTLMAVWMWIRPMIMRNWYKKAYSNAGTATT